MVKIRMRKTMKRNKIKKQHQKYSRKHKKTIKQKKHHKGGKYSKTLRGGDICLKEVTNKTPPEVNRIGDENTNLAKKSSSGSFFGSLGSLFGNKNKETTPNQEVKIVDKKTTDVNRIGDENTTDVNRIGDENTTDVNRIDDENTNLPKKTSWGLGSLFGNKNKETTPNQEVKIVDKKITDDIKNPLLSPEIEDTSIVSPRVQPEEAEFVKPPPPPLDPGQVSTQSDNLPPPPPPPASLQVLTQSDNRPPPPPPPEQVPTQSDDQSPPGRPEADPPVVDERLAPYIKLRRMKVPDAGIRIRMKTDGFTQAEIDDLLGPDLSASAPKEPYRRPPLRTLEPAAPLQGPTQGDNLAFNTSLVDMFNERLNERYKNTGLNVDEKNVDKQNEDDDKEEWEGGKSRRRRRKMKSSRKNAKKVSKKKIK